MIAFKHAPALVAALTIAGAAMAQDAPSRDTVLAQVGETAITLGHLLAARENLPDQFRALPPETVFDPLLEQLIEQTAVMQAVEGSLTSMEQIALDNERRAFMANIGLTRAVEAATTDENIAEAYAAFAQEFDGRDPVQEFNASHIIVETEGEAVALRAQLDDGADFAELARAHSFDGAAANGGNLGWFGPGAMIPEFEEAVRGLEPGEFMGPLETRFGWHLVLLNETRMTTAPALEDVREMLVQNLQREAAQAELNRLRDSVTITRNTDGIDPSILNQTDPLDD
jgi:peptidyl-prolyl cis-trans isomerase C